MLNTYATIPSSLAFVTEMSSTSYKVVMKPEAGAAKQIDLSELIRWKSNAPYGYDCGAKTIKVCTDSACGSLATAALATGVAVEDAEGKVQATLSLSQTTPRVEYLYI